MACRSAAWVAVLLLPSVFAIIPSSFQQTSIPFNASFKTGSKDLPIAGPLANPNQTNDIVSQQHHVTYINETAVMVTWISGNGVLFNGTGVPANAVNVTTSLRLTPASNSVQGTPFRRAPYVYEYGNTYSTANVSGETDDCGKTSM